jgi:hypothetical protein
MSASSPGANARGVPQGGSLRRAGLTDWTTAGSARRGDTTSIKGRATVPIAFPAKWGGMQPLDRVGWVGERVGGWVDG